MTPSCPALPCTRARGGARGVDQGAGTRRDQRGPGHGDAHSRHGACRTAGSTRFRQTKELTQEAREWEQVKEATGGLHFLAIQTDEEAESTDGFWILQDFTASQF